MPIVQDILKILIQMAWISVYCASFFILYACISEVKEHTSDWTTQWLNIF